MFFEYLKAEMKKQPNRAGQDTHDNEEVKTYGNKQLFVELLIIGMGAGIWFALLLAAILGYRFDSGNP